MCAPAARFFLSKVTIVETRNMATFSILCWEARTKPLQSLRLTKPVFVVGIGCLIPHIQAQGPRDILAVDVSPKMLAEVTARFGQAPTLGNTSTVRTWLGPIEELPPHQGRADAMFMNAVFGNLADPQAALWHACTLLNPGGRVVISHPEGMTASSGPRAHVSVLCAKSCMLALCTPGKMHSDGSRHRRCHEAPGTIQTCSLYISLSSIGPHHEALSSHNLIKASSLVFTEHSMAKTYLSAAHISFFRVVLCCYRTCPHWTRFQALPQTCKVKTCSCQWPYPLHI